MHILHPGDSRHICGFEELFVYLEISSVTLELQQLITTSFAKSPVLQPHLSKFSSRAHVQRLNSVGTSPVSGYAQMVGPRHGKTAMEV